MQLSEDCVLFLLILNVSSFNKIIWKWLWNTLWSRAFNMNVWHHMTSPLLKFMQRISLPLWLTEILLTILTQVECHALLRTFLNHQPCISTNLCLQHSLHEYYERPCWIFMHLASLSCHNFETSLQTYGNSEMGYYIHIFFIIIIILRQKTCFDCTISKLRSSNYGFNQELIMERLQNIKLRSLILLLFLYTYFTGHNSQWLEILLSFTVRIDNWKEKTLLQTASHFI